MILYLLVTVAVLCAVHLLFNYNRTARILRKLPGPKDVFIVGNALEILISPVELFKLGRTYANKWDGLYRFWAYPMGAVSIYNPEDIEIVVSTMKHSEKSNIYAFLKPWLQDGLLVSNGAKWQQRRKILTPAFHFNILRQFCVILDENAQRLVNKLDNMTEELVDVTPLLTDFTLNSICETAMGTQLTEYTSKSAKTYKEAIYEIGKVFVKRFSTVYYYSDFIFNMSKVKRKQDRYVKTIHEFTEKVINDRKKYTEEHGSLIRDTDMELEDNMTGNKKRTAMLDLLIQAEKEGLINGSGIQEEVDTFMFEGHDTTASGLMFCLMLLANHGEIQDKIVFELKEVLNQSNGKISIEDLSKMRYLERCIKESLRLYPPVPFISRILSETVQLSNYTVPAGTFCHIHIYDLHRRKDLFESPEKFDPDRHLPENCSARHPYAYIPFSAGPRNCIGQKFALMEMKLLVSTILIKYKLLPVTRPSDIQIPSDLVLRNNGPIYVKFMRRYE